MKPQTLRTGDLVMIEVFVPSISKYVSRPMLFLSRKRPSHRQYGHKMYYVFLDVGSPIVVSIHDIRRGQLLEHFSRTNKNA